MMELCLITVAPLLCSARVVVGREGKPPQLHGVSECRPTGSTPDWEWKQSLGSLVLQEPDPDHPVTDLHLASSHLWFTVLPAREHPTSSLALAGSNLPLPPASPD